MTNEQILTELQKISEEFGHFPTYRDLNHIDFLNVRNAIRRSKIKLGEFAIKLGYKYQFFSNWTKDEVICKLKEMINIFDCFPAYKEIDKVYGLKCAIKKFGGYNHFRELLGFEQTGIHPLGHWNNFENLEKEIKVKFADLLAKNQFPTLKMINVEIASCVVSKFGGITEVAKRMGFEPSTFFVTSDGHFVNSSYEYIVDEFLWSRGIPHEVNDRLPSSNYMFDFKIDSFYVEVWGYGENNKSSRGKNYKIRREEKEKYYKNNNFNLISIEPELFNKKLNEIEEELELLFSNYGFDVSLKQVQYDVKNVTKHCGYWTEEKILEEANKIIKKYGTIPGQMLLRNDGYSGFITVVDKQLGGLCNLRDMLGIENKKRDKKNYWNDTTIILELQKIIDQIHKFPSYTEIETYGIKGLRGAITRYGNITKFRSLMNV